MTAENKELGLRQYKGLSHCDSTLLLHLLSTALAVSLDLWAFFLSALPVLDNEDHRESLLLPYLNYCKILKLEMWLSGRALAHHEQGPGFQPLYLQ